MQLLDGKVVSTKIKDEIKEEILQLGINPCLAIIRVGDDQASKVYVNNKIKNCEYTGIQSIDIILPEETTQEKLIEEIQTLNKNKDVNGILVQLPLPKHINKDIIINTIDPNKDVDCFHPQNIGKLFVGNSIFKPCTPWGVIELLKHYNIEIAGKHCVIIGRSDIVGKPMAHLMLQENATVTIAHSKTIGIKELTKSADIIISAIGKAKFIDSSYLFEPDEYMKEFIVEKFGNDKYEEMKRRQTLVDVGINRDENGKLCGDIDFDNVKEIADAISPVPGGIGIMTTTMLMKNTLIAYKIQNNL